MTPAHIRRERKRLGLSQPALAVLVGTDGTSVSRWERGVVTPSPDAIDRLRQAFAGKPPEDIGTMLARIERKLDALHEELLTWRMPDGT